MRTIVLFVGTMIAHRIGELNWPEWSAFGLLLICAFIGDILKTDIQQPFKRNRYK